ncbi:MULTISPECIES: hypothetical protein [Flavobacterium]|uniref:hypothetical protein n=1 Tax=Flavobacterium TaxID=237 RepID=UPI001FCAFDCE|nr:MULTISPECIES: hypothetical protein [Flavobacterium]UOK42840.1 hypothetical protein LZF87_01630 [Flavobacterium enshiense]
MQPQKVVVFVFSEGEWLRVRSFNPRFGIVGVGTDCKSALSGYVLFDKEGKLVNENAFGPKEEKCKAELLQLLNK